jgi:long-chain acyl-CoA synthetase
MNLAEAFVHCAERHKDKTAVFWGENEVCYGELVEKAERVAAHLTATLKVQAGDRIGIWLKNCPEFIGAFFGVLQAGAVVVPINNFLKPEEVAHILGDAGIKVVISDSSFAEAAEAVRKLRAEVEVVQFDRLGDPPPHVGGYRVGGMADDTAVLIYTSGTTGRSKGAMLTHRNLLANVESCRQVLLAVEADRFVVLLPLFHSFMMTVGMLLPLLVGGSIVLIRSLHPPKNIIAEILNRHGTLLPAVPQFFRTLANAGLPKDSPLRLCVSGGAPLPLEILREFNEKMPIPLIEGYGLSEASPVVSMNPIKGPWKAGSIGVPVPNVEVNVQDEAGNVLAEGQTGEICVRGSNVMKGYWNKPEETAKAMRKGWLLTGDIGHRDADGYFFITDRKKDMLLVNGINVYPREIEEMIYQFAGIKEAAVIGVPDARRGEQPLAFVSTAEGVPVDEKALLHFLRGKLADYKVPKRIISLPALPRNATGKILKRVLKEQVAAQGVTNQS